jgi:hypothetical protein
MADIDSYLKSLGARLGERVEVPFKSVSISEWRPMPRCCHANVDCWVSGQTGRKALRGWLIDGTDGLDGFLVVAHSVVDECGELYDITPRDGSPLNPNERRWFLRHNGTTEEFDAMPKPPSHWVSRTRRG